MILLIDNYDSFTYNLYQYLAELNFEVKVVRNDMITKNDVARMEPEAIVISPGPGLPHEAGNASDIVQHVYETIPILGVCLGHQIIAQTLGGHVIPARTIKHGKQSRITHDQLALFDQLTQPLDVMRYHSQMIDPETLPEELAITATSLDDKTIMAIKHQHYPVFGVQFHPESIGTATGKTIIKNFLNEIGAKQYETIS